jgi:redox-sensitive bicupin YhaK (pirin superfamily)
MPSAEIASQGGRLQGFQIWVNLPARDKMMAPRYQEVPSAKIPVGRSESGDVEVRVIAGESLGVKAVIDTRVPIEYLHFTLKPGATHTQQVPADQNAIAYVIKGEATFEGKAAREQDVVLFSNDGEQVTFSNSSNEPVEFLLLSGRPLNEPVARYGPFVMNTEAEVRQAFDDFRTGKMGTLD